MQKESTVNLEEPSITVFRFCELILASYRVFGESTVRSSLFGVRDARLIDTGSKYAEVAAVYRTPCHEYVPGCDCLDTFL